MGPPKNDYEMHFPVDVAAGLEKEYGLKVLLNLEEYDSYLVSRSQSDEMGSFKILEFLSYMALASRGTLFKLVVRKN